MSIEVKLPELGENISSGDLLKVLVKVGEKINKDQAVLELETDKAAIEVPSPSGGVVRQIHVKEGQKVKVGQVIISLDENGAKPQEAPPARTPEPVAAGIGQGARPPVEQPLGKGIEARTATASGPAPSNGQQAKPAATPASGTRTTEIKLPELGENVTGGDLLKVLVKPGETISKDQSLLEIETDKAAIEVPSPISGTVKQVHVQPGQKVKVGQLIFTVEESGAAVSAQATGSAAVTTTMPTAPPPTQAAAPAPPVRTTPAATPLPSVPPASAEAPFVPSTTGRSLADVPASPSVRRLAREIGVDITEVHGSGPSGRVTMDDVKAHSRRRHMEQRTAPAAGLFAPAPLPDFTRWGTVEAKPMTGIRRKTAEHMQQAWTIPHVTNNDKADITDLEQLRKQFSASVEKAGGKLTMTAIALKIVASALKKFPQFAASIDLAKEQVIYKQYFHIGVAVDTERGLLVPVIRDVDKKNIVEISVELSQFAAKARDRKLKPEDMEGGVFTITNLGGIGGTSFTPIINSPEVAILGMMRANWEPVYTVGKFEPRLMLPLSLSYDHRIIDGADAARFLRWLCEAFEQPFLLSLQG
ncbi:MAG TPA: dihydrolipoyllysine-residue acetyltransferase [Terriglobales bacterium]|nr:dihydrolipoyllysine-residue acetyltransferase [Terriglobales bacterium]